MLRHANTDLKSGWANYVFSSNEVHRWHYSAEPREANANFGNALLIWDQLFGTFHHLPSGDAPARIGLFGASTSYPGRVGYFAELRSKLSPACCAA